MLIGMQQLAQALNRLIDDCERQFELPLLVSNS